MNIKNNRRRGFTLIELLVVILILAILAALVVPRMIGHTDDAKRAAAVANIKEFSDALQRFRLDTGRFPTSEEGLMALRVRPDDVNIWNGPYIQHDPPADPWGFEYQYEQSGDGYIVTSYGQDGAPGGEGNASDIVDDSSNPTSQ